MRPPTFAEAALRLELNGFEPIPITLPRAGDPHAGKRPSVGNWPKYVPVAERVEAFAPFGVGVLTAMVPAVDIDVRDAEIADAIARGVERLIGEAPVRFGAAPKRLYACRSVEPHPRMTSQEFRLRADPPEAKRQKVEILWHGQQYVAFGIHPGTGMPYGWPHESMLDVERNDLPELTPELAARIIAGAEAVLRKAGAVPVGSRARAASVAARQPGPAPRPVRDLREVRRVLDVLRKINPSGLDRDTWIACGYGLKAALGERGREVWLAWTARSSKAGKSGESDTAARTWASINPQRAGWRFLERLAEEIGHG